MAKKRKKNALPKRIGGVKIPKPVRRGLVDFMNSQTGKVVAAEAMTALTAALAGTQRRKGSATRQFMRDHDVGEKARDAAGAATSAGAALSFAIGEATRSFAEALHRGKAVADAKSVWEPAEETPARKKPAASEVPTPH